MKVDIKVFTAFLFSKYHKKMTSGFYNMLKKENIKLYLKTLGSDSNINIFFQISDK